MPLDVCMGTCELENQLHDKRAFSLTTLYAFKIAFPTYVASLSL